MSVRRIRNAACSVSFAAAALLAACQGNIGSGGSGLPAAPGGVAPGQGGGGPGVQSRQRIVDGAVYLTSDTAQIPLPTLGKFSVTIALASALPVSAGASPYAGAQAAAGKNGRPSPGASAPSPAASGTPALSSDSPAPVPSLSPPATASAGPSPSASGTLVPQAAAASPASSPAASPPHGSKAANAAAPSPTPSGPKIDTKLTIYPEDAPSAPTSAPTGNVQSFIKRVPIVRGYIFPRVLLTLPGLSAVHFTIPGEELTPNRGFTVALYDQSKKHHDRLVAVDTNATLSGDSIAATASPSPIPLKKNVGYAFLLYGDELAPPPPNAGGSYPPPGNNPFATPGPGGPGVNPYGSPAPPNPFATPTAYNPYAPPTPYNPYAPPTPYNPYAPTVPPH
jgi:hypothetical protein